MDSSKFEELTTNSISPIYDDLDIISRMILNDYPKEIIIRSFDLLISRINALRNLVTDDYQKGEKFSEQANDLWDKLKKKYPEAHVVTMMWWAKDELKTRVPQSAQVTMDNRVEGVATIESILKNPMFHSIDLS